MFTAFILVAKEMNPAKFIHYHLFVFLSDCGTWWRRRARTFKEEVWSEAKKLVKEAKNARLILYTLRPYLAPFKTDCEKKGLSCKLLQVTHTYVCADLRMEENKINFKQQSRTKSKKGGKVNFLHGDCLHSVVLFDFIPGLCFHIKDNILSICATIVFIHIFHDP